MNIFMPCLGGEQTHAVHAMRSKGIRTFIAVIVCDDFFKNGFAAHELPQEQVARKKRHVENLLCTTRFLFKVTETARLPGVAPRFGQARGRGGPNIPLLVACGVHAERGTKNGARRH